MASPRNKIHFCIFYFRFSSNHFILNNRCFPGEYIQMFVLLLMEFFTNEQHINSHRCRYCNWALIGCQVSHTCGSAQWLGADEFCLYLLLFWPLVSSSEGFTTPDASSAVFTWNHGHMHFNARIIKISSEFLRCCDLRARWNYFSHYKVFKIQFLLSVLRHSERCVVLLRRDIIGKTSVFSCTAQFWAFFASCLTCQTSVQETYKTNI